jgi:inorganic triphosphatase YgiF
METELKLSLQAQDLPCLLAHPLLSTSGSRQRLLNTYFDTPELALQQAHMAVRERLSGDQWLLTVKTAGQSTGGLSRRQEWEGPTTPGALQFDQLLDDTALSQTLMALRPRLQAMCPVPSGANRFWSWSLNCSAARNRP